MIKITLPLSVSVNSAYGNNKKKGRHKTKAYKKFISDATDAISKFPEYEIIGDEWLKVLYVVNIPLYTKAGKKRIVDVFNYEKTLSDFLAKNITGFDDHKILEGQIIKKNSTDYTIDIYISEIKESKNQGQGLDKKNKKE